MTTALHFAPAAIVDAGIDSFFESKVALFRVAGHWAECTKFNDLGNHTATLCFVPVAGQAPRRLFPGQMHYPNVFSLQIRKRGSDVLMMVLNHTHGYGAPREFVAPDKFSAVDLQRWFDTFAAFAKANS